MTNNPHGIDGSPNPIDKDMIQVLEILMERDEGITARAVARLHPTIKHASSITRSDSRSALLAQYQTKQREMRTYAKRIKKGSVGKITLALTEKDQKIAELERQVEILTASHVALIRAVGELGGIKKWAQFYEKYKDVRTQLIDMGAMPSADVFVATTPNPPSSKA